MEEVTWSLCTLQEKNPEAHSPSTGSFPMKTLGKGFVFCCQLLLQNFVMFITTSLESCQAEGALGQEIPVLSLGAPHWDLFPTTSPRLQSTGFGMLRTLSAMIQNRTPQHPRRQQMRSCCFEMTESWRWFYYWPCCNLGNNHHPSSALVK